MADYFENDRLHDIRGKLDVIKGRIDLLKAQKIGEEIEDAITTLLDTLEASLNPDALNGPATWIQSVFTHVDRLMEEFGKIREIAEKAIRMTYLEEEPEKIDLGKIINSFINEVENIWKSESIHFTVKTEKGLKLKIKRTHLESILMNLLSNARKAVQASDNKEIFIKAYLNDAGCHLVVRDTGCGISEKMLAEIWTEGVSNTDSTGIGLASIVRYKLLYDLSINLESKEGKGTQVDVIFPYIF